MRFPRTGCELGAEAGSGAGHRADMAGGHGSRVLALRALDRERAHWEQAFVEKVQGFGGSVVQRSPSLIMVAFGLPQTLEQLPQRAVQAALAIRQLVEAEARAGLEPCPMVRQAVHWGSAGGGAGAQARRAPVARE